MADGVIRMDHGGWFRIPRGQTLERKALSVPESDHPVAFCICNETSTGPTSACVPGNSEIRSGLMRLELTAF